MKKSIPGLIVLILFLSALPCYSQSQIGYVSDMLLLTFREGPGTSFPITKTLTSNTQVNILKDKNGYYKVQLENDEIGWVEKQYIIFTTPKTIKITQLEKQLQNFDDRMSKLQMINSSLEELVNSQKAEYSSKLNALETELNKEKNEKTLALKNFSESQKKYDNLIEKSENIKQVITENNELSEQNNLLSSRLERLERANNKMFKTSMIYWFLAGAGVLFLGWLIGHNVSLRKRRASSLLD